MQIVRSGYGYGMTVSACLWLGLFPLLQGGTYARLTHDKWIVMLILTGITVLTFAVDLFYLIRRKDRLFRLPRRGFLPLVLAAALFLWIVLSCLLSSYDPDTWLLGTATRYEGLLSQFCYLIIFVCFFLSRVHLKPVLISAAAGVIVFCIIVLLQRGGSNPLGLYPGGRSYEQNPEFQGTIGNIDMGTGYLLLLAGLFLTALLPVRDIPQKRSPLLTVFLLAVFFIDLYLILTMDVQFGVISLAVLFLITLLRYLPEKSRLLLLILLIVLVLLAVWFWPGYGGGIWELHEILHGRTRLSFGSNRVAVWYYSLLLARENLLTGGGSGTFRSRFNRFLLENGFSIPSEQDGRALPDYFDTPHNEYIAMLTNHGLPALILFIILLFLSVYRRKERWLPLLTPCSASVLCYAVQAFFSFSVCIVAPMFWVILALSFVPDSEG